MQYAVRQTVVTWFTSKEERKPRRHVTETIIPCFDKSDAMDMVSTLTNRVRPSFKPKHSSSEYERGFDVVCIIHTSKGRTILSMGDVEMIAQDYVANSLTD